MVQQHSTCLSTICSSHSGQQQAEALCNELVGRIADSFIQFGPGNRCMHTIDFMKGRQIGVMSILCSLPYEALDLLSCFGLQLAPGMAYFAKN